MNNSESKTYRIGRTSLIRHTKALVIGVAVVLVLAALVPVVFGGTDDFLRIFRAWTVIGLILVGLYQIVLRVVSDGTCPNCGMFNTSFDQTIAAEIGITGNELSANRLLTCEYCLALILVNKKTSEAHIATDADLPTATKFSVKIDKDSVWPEAAVCCNGQVEDRIDLDFADTDTEAATVARIAAGLIGGSMASKAVGWAVDPSGLVVSLRSVPVCSKHRTSLSLEAKSGSVFLVLPTLIGRNRFVSANQEIDQ